jgi:hypothetical protein
MNDPLINLSKIHNSCCGYLIVNLFGFDFVFRLAEQESLLECLMSFLNTH